jgi:hypothetical protein
MLAVKKRALKIFVYMNGRILKNFAQNQIISPVDVLHLERHSLEVLITLIP